MIYMYVENRSDRCIALEAVSAEADGLTGDLVFYYASVAPGRREAGWVCFDGDIRALKGIEDLTLGLRLYEADTLDELGYSGTGEYRDLEPVTVQYPPQVWGEYECEGLKLVVKPRYNDLITVETGGEDGSLFSVFETASLEAECSFEGAGALFGISRVSEDRFHELLFYDMSGTRPFARDENGNPTMVEQFNPNGSYWAIEGITSPDGRVLGKMAHSERRGTGVAMNISGDQNQLVFESGVAYFKD